MNNCILIISAVYPPEPVVSAHLSSDLYKALKGNGVEVKVMHPKPTRPNGFNFGQSISVGEDEIIVESYTCPQSSFVGRVRESFSFGRSCSDYIRHHYEEIACIYVNAWPLGSQYLIVKTANKYSIPIAMHVQDVYPESLSNKLPSFWGCLFTASLLHMDKYILKNSNKVITISEKVKDHLVKTRGIDEDKVTVVINWQDESDFLEYQKVYVEPPHEKFSFMYLGNIGPVAGVDLLIDAFTFAEIDNARLVIAGSGSMKAMLIEKARFNHNVEFWDVPYGKVPEMQSKADVMLLPTKKGAASSSIPSKLPAYMFSAKPIIGALDEDSDTANAIIESGCGVVVEPEDVGALASTMKEMAAKDRKELKLMGQKGIEYALARFSKESNMKKLIKAIKELI